MTCTLKLARNILKIVDGTDVSGWHGFWWMAWISRIFSALSALGGCFVISLIYLAGRYKASIDNILKL